MLAKEGLQHQRVNYYKEPLTAGKLKELLRKMKLHAKDLLRESEPIYRELELGKKKDQMNEAELIELMIQYPDLMQRPIIERGDRAVLGRPTEKIQELLK